MKQKLFSLAAMKTWLMLLCLTAGGVFTASADEVTLKAGTNGSACKVNNQDGIKVGTSSKGGDMTITVPANTATLHLHAAAWKGVTGLSLKITGATANPSSISLTADDGISNNSPFTLSGTESDFEFSVALSEITQETTLTFSSSTTKRFVVWGASAELSGSSSTPTCATPTFSPAAGAVVAGTTVALTTTTEGASIYYTTDGSNPTTSSTLYSAPIAINVATTIKAIAVKDGYDNSPIAEAAYTIKQSISGYNVDFESDLDDYVDWTFTNAGRSSTDITAHGGTYYATTGGKETASFQTKEKVDLPGTLTFYVSKTSNNTTASNWEVQVSTDGTNWTKVGESQSATSMDKGAWTEVTRELSGYDDVYVRIYYKGSTAVRAIDDISLTMRDPNAKKTPTVSIDATGLTTSDIAGQTNVSAGTLAATVTSGETTITTPAVTWSSSNTNVATVNASTGSVTLLAAGTTTITATFAGNDDYTEATATYELTVVDTQAKGQLNNPYTVSEAIAAYDAAGADISGIYVKGIVSEIVTAYSSQYGNISFNISEDGKTDGSQLLAFRCFKGANKEKFTSEDCVLEGDKVVLYGDITLYNNKTYELKEGNYIVSQEREKGDPTIPSDAIEVAYGATHTVSGVTGGEVSLAVANPAVATVSGQTITPVAVGTTTLTITTAETDFYNAGQQTVTLTVTAPEGKTTAAPSSASYVKVTSTDDLTDGQYLIVYEGGNVAFNGGLEKLDATSNTVAVTISDGTIAPSDELKAATFTIESSDGGYTIKSASGNYIGQTSDANGLVANASTTYTNTISFDESGNANIVSGGAYLRYNDASNQTRFRYYKSSSYTNQKAIQLYKFVAAEPITVKLNAAGYATFCSEYPLDFSNYEEAGFSAWSVTGVSDTEVTFSQITGSVKGGEGILLKGDANAVVTLTSVDSEGKAEGNLLQGTLAPQFVGDNEFYGLSGESFVKVKSGTVKAHKALLPASVVNGGGQAKALVFVFGDDATSVNEVGTKAGELDGVIYNLAGQRIQKMQKGINIVNGKKILK